MDLREVHGVKYDSRQVQPDDCFVAMQGGSVDGNLYIDKAIAAGAIMVVTDSPGMLARGAELHPDIRFEYAEHGRRALAEIAAEVYSHPERRLAISAVTGTNGKTTTAWLLEQMLRSAGRKCVLIGTIETHVGEELRVSEHTTPESSDLYKLFADGAAAGCTEVIMEMSSHALEQERVWGIPVDVAIFTNLTQDHLDYHGTMEAYGAAKAKLFYGVGTPAPRVAVVNRDDSFGRGLLDDLDPVCEIVSYGIDGGMCRATEVRYEAGRTRFVWHTGSRQLAVESPLSGRVNVYNLLAALAAALARGLTAEEVVTAAKSLRQVPGRFETVPNKLGFAVVVDYAHTDDALRNLISLARELVRAEGGRVITVFGCGGDRDRTKRPKMGRVAGEGSDLLVLTNDNPRSENPAAILAEVLVGVRETSTEYIVLENRAEAISEAVTRVMAGDIVLIAGKGHEKIQILQDGAVSFDDVAVAAEALRRREVQV